MFINNCKTNGYLSDKATLQEYTTAVDAIATKLNSMNDNDKKKYSDLLFAAANCWGITPECKKILEQKLPSINSHFKPTDVLYGGRKY
jgi:hypothetical protein